jgi:hypothetical protein
MRSAHRASPGMIMLSSTPARPNGRILACVWNYERSALWQRTLAERANDPEEEPRARLRVSYRQLREKVILIAAEIARDLPDFTVHDVSHLDALWQMADLIAGPGLSINPLEAFVLGASFLTHDLGLGIAAYPEGKAALHNDALWADTVSALLRRRLGRPPSRFEIESAEEAVHVEATATVLRSRHAARSEQLFTASWRVAGTSSDIFLIDDPELRRMYGALIGKIAHSHWWDLSDLRKQLSLTLGAAVGFPQSWPVRALKLSCLLRAADAIHLDARRAPGLLFSVRAPKGAARHHWAFQNKLHQPQLRFDRIEFTTGDPFGVDETAAWWLCFDILREVNRELQRIDSLLADANEERLAARGVMGIDEPDRLRKYIPTSGWSPVDTSVQISDVASLVSRLGGEQLYGPYSKAPLRELIQNASDAIRARRLLEALPTSRGNVKVSLLVRDGAHFLEVSDDGVGMSERVLTKSLLDFGTSFWESTLVTDELPSVLSQGFRPTGKYGIGFFSVFMWADVVTVITRRYDEGYRDTRVLEFKAGVSERPILRAANAKEYLREGGTTVRILLRRPPSSDGGLLSTYTETKHWRLLDLVRWLCPAAGVNIFTEEDGKEREAVRANDWLTIPGHELLKRLDNPPYRRPPSKVLQRAGKQMQIITDSDGRPIARAAILSGKGYLYDFDGVVAVDGFRHCQLRGIQGVFEGTSAVASRDLAIPLANTEQLGEWATRQTSIIGDLAPDEAAYAARIILSCSGHADNLPIVRTCRGWLNQEEFRSFAKELDEILLVEIEWSDLEPFLGHLDLKPNVAAAFSRQDLLPRRGGSKTWPGEIDHPWRWWAQEVFSPLGSAITSLADSWNLPIAEVLDAIEFDTEDGEFIEVEIGTANGKPFLYRVGIVKRLAPERAARF